MPSGLDDRLELLLKRYREGDVDAFDEFFRKTKRIVHAYVRRRVANPENAQDITQDIYFRIHRYVLTFDSEKGSALGWLRSVAHNTITDHLNQQKSRQALLETESFNNDYEQKDMNDRLFFKELVYQFEGHLNHEDLSLVLDRVLEEESFNDIGKKHGIRADHARQKYSRLIKKLKTILR